MCIRDRADAWTARRILCLYRRRADGGRERLPACAAAGERICDRHHRNRFGPPGLVAVVRRVVDRLGHRSGAADVCRRARGDGAHNDAHLAATPEPELSMVDRPSSSVSPEDDPTARWLWRRTLAFSGVLVLCIAAAVGGRG